MSVNIVKVKGHASHEHTSTLVVEGRSVGANARDVDRLHAEESKEIFDFLRSHLPSGTLDKLAVRLGRHAINHLINRGDLREHDHLVDTMISLGDRVRELDAK